MDIRNISTTQKWFHNGITPAYTVAPWQPSNYNGNTMYPDVTGQIDYKLNSLGYRDIEWTDNDINDAVWCIGHSDVFGLGVEHTATWQYNLPFKTINLGIAGASWDTISRIISSGLSKYRPKAIVIQATTDERKEYITKDIQQVVLPSMPAKLLPHKDIWRYDDDVTFEYTKEKNIALIRWACMATNTPLIMFELVNRWDLIKIDPAVDKQHIGVKTHKLISEYIIQELQSL